MGPMLVDVPMLAEELDNSSAIPQVFKSNAVLPTHLGGFF
jgi:hypothetical protein